MELIDIIGVLVGLVIGGILGVALGSLMLDWWK